MKGGLVYTATVLVFAIYGERSSIQITCAPLDHPGTQRFDRGGDGEREREKGEIRYERG